MTVAETIKQITRDHLLKGNGVALGQCLTAVGWVGGTVPELTEADGLIELSMADVAGGAIAVGTALAGRRPIYIVRYQGFQWYDAASIVNYAAKSKEMWNVPCPIFVRSIAMEGAIGPVAGSSHHGMFHRMPGITIASPMTPGEYRAVWEYFISHDEPVYASEHRKSFAVDYELPDSIHPKADITLFPISVTRFAAVEAARQLEKEGIICNVVHLLWLKPFVVTDLMKQAVANSTYGGLVLDDDYVNGVSKSLAYDLMHGARKEVAGVLGLDERTAGFAAHLDNLPPSAEKIAQAVKAIMGK